MAEKFLNTYKKGSSYKFLQRKRKNKQTNKTGSDPLQSLGHDFRLLNWNMYFTNFITRRTTEDI